MSDLNEIERLILPELLAQSNLRTLPWWQEWLGYALSEWRPFRRWVGGKWEWWYMDCVHSFMWHPVTDWSNAERRPTVICRGTPTQEEYA